MPQIEFTFESVQLYSRAPPFKYLLASPIKSVLKTQLYYLIFFLFITTTNNSHIILLGLESPKGMSPTFNPFLHHKKIDHSVQMKRFDNSMHLVKRYEQHYLLNDMNELITLPIHFTLLLQFYCSILFFICLLNQISKKIMWDRVKSSH